MVSFDIARLGTINPTQLDITNHWHLLATKISPIPASVICFIPNVCHLPTKVMFESWPTMESGLTFPLLLLLAAAIAAAWFALDYFCAPRLSEKEPPLVPHPVPYIGHILGLLRHGTRYYEMTRSVALMLLLAEETYAKYSYNAVQNANSPSTL